jgi:hypothetical protein
MDINQNAYRDSSWSMRYLSFFFAFLFMVGPSPVTGQDESKALVSFHNSVVFVGVDNPFRVVIQQPESVGLDQLSAVLLTYDDETEPSPIPLEINERNFGFTIQPREAGIVSITIVLRDGKEERYNFNTRPLTAASKLGGVGAKSAKSIPINVFKSQRGIYAEIEGFDINAKCEIISYEVIYITAGKDAEIVFNAGGNFQQEARILISLAKPGDRYIFTKIRYRCPGALVDQLGETLSFELK